MKSDTLPPLDPPKTFFRKCHLCGTVTESLQEIQRCPHCHHSFAPLNYFQKVHSKDGSTRDLYESSQQLMDDDMIKGITCLW